MNIKLIGIDIQRDYSRYTKFIQLRGSNLLDGMILPDVGLLVNINDFMKGKFQEMMVRSNSRLRMHSKAVRSAKDVIIFTVARVPYDIAKVDDAALHPLRQLINAGD